MDVEHELIPLLVRVTLPGKLTVTSAAHEFQDDHESILNIQILVGELFHPHEGFFWRNPVDC